MKYLKLFESFYSETGKPLKESIEDDEDFNEECEEKLNYYQIGKLTILNLVDKISGQILWFMNR